jgi:hypothetical protein
LSLSLSLSAWRFESEAALAVAPIIVARSILLPGVCRGVGIHCDPSFFFFFVVVVVVVAGQSKGGCRYT